MAQLGQAFDSGKHDDMNTGFEPMPADNYIAKLVESDVLPTSKKTGKYIKCKFEIIKGEYKGRFVWTNINIVNPNPMTVDIAQKELATLCRACGKGVITDTAVLHGIPIEMKVKIKPAKNDYPAGNEPCGYSAIGGGESESPDFVDSESDSESEGDAPWDAENADVPDDDIPY